MDEPVQVDVPLLPDDIRQIASKNQSLSVRWHTLAGSVAIPAQELNTEDADQAAEEIALIPDSSQRTAVIRSLLRQHVVTLQHAEILARVLLAMDDECRRFSEQAAEWVRTCQEPNQSQRVSEGRNPEQ